jgi:hypothetical protein
MAPTDRHTRRQAAKLGTGVRQAALHATPQQLADLYALVAAVHAGHVTIHDARTTVAQLRRTQHGHAPSQRHAA